MSTDTIERLKAANLVPQADETPPFTDTAQRIALLNSPPPRRRWRAPRLPRLALPYAAAAGIAGALAVAVPNIGAPNVIAEARAAVAPGQDIVHVVTRLRIPAADRKPGGWDGRQERWSTTDPYRTRTVSPAKTPDGQPGSVQTVFDGTTAYVRRSWDDHDIAERLSAEQQREDAESRRKLQGDPYLQGVAFAGDPMQDLRVLLANGSLRQTGQTDIDGRQVQRLAAHVPRRVTATQQGDFVDPAVDFDYFVDAKTFTPVRVTTTTTLDNGTQNVTTTDFLTYERLPDTPANAELVTLPPR